MAEAEPGTPTRRERPMSPHLQVWRWHITMATSILHRATGVGLYVGILIATGWAMSLAAGPTAFDAYMALLGSPLGKLVLFGGINVSLLDDTWELGGTTWTQRRAQPPHRIPPPQSTRARDVDPVGLGVAGSRFARRGTRAMGAAT